MDKRMRARAGFVVIVAGLAVITWLIPWTPHNSLLLVNSGESYPALLVIADILLTLGLVCAGIAAIVGLILLLVALWEAGWGRG